MTRSRVRRYERPITIFVTARPYRCAGCAAVHQVGLGGRWAMISELKAAGCPDCAGTVFRPLPLGAR